MKIKSMSYVILMTCSILVCTNVAFAGFELQTNKATYKVGEPIILRTLFKNETSSPISYSPTISSGAIISIYYVSPYQAANPRTVYTFQTTFNGNPKTVNYIYIHNLAPAATPAGTFNPFSTDTFCFGSACSYGINILKGIGDPTNLTQIRLTTQTPFSDTVLGSGDSFIINTTGTYKADLTVGGVSINGSTPSSGFKDTVYFNVT